MRTRATNIFFKYKQIISEIRVCVSVCVYVSSLFLWLCDWRLVLKQIKYPKSLCTMWISWLYDTFFYLFPIHIIHIIFAALFLWILWHWQLYRCRYNIFFSLHYTHSLWYSMYINVSDAFFLISNTLWLLYK